VDVDVDEHQRPDEAHYLFTLFIVQQPSIMSSRRSSRCSAGSSSRAPIQPSIRRGLESLVIVGDNASYIAKMLSVDAASASSSDKIVNALETCMGMNNLTAEMLLARFFDASVLSHYSQEVLVKSGKGSAATLAARIAKEWSKPDFQSSSSSVAKRKREGDDGGESSKKSAPSEKVSKDQKEEVVDDDEDDDWKRPLFYWKGKLNYDSEKNNLRWYGSWISGLAEHGMPEEREFEKTKQIASFELSNTGKLIRDPSAEQNGEPLDSSPVGLSGRFKGSYLLDQGDGRGPSKYRDLSHNFAFASEGGERTKGPILVAACGTTEFGSFVSAGYVRVTPDIADATTGSTEVGELVLARRYIGDDDSRTSLVKNAKLVLDACFKAAPFDPDRKSFWTDLLPRKS
jgi:hypothetical protein